MTDVPPLEPPTTGVALPSPAIEIPEAPQRFQSLDRQLPPSAPSIGLEIVEEGETPSNVESDELPAALETQPVERRSLLEEIPDESDGDSDANPRRRKGLLGRVFRREKTVPPPARSRTRAREVEPDEERDADYAERLEDQIRQAAGKHLKEVGVDVRGRNVRVRALADRFWNRRMVRRAIEELPMLAGYEADIRVE